MKKLIFLLLMAVFLTGFVSATDTAYPPWDISLDAALSELGVDGPAVTSDTVLAAASLNAERPAGVDRYDKYTRLIILWGKQYLSGELSRNEYASLITAAISLLKPVKPVDTGQLTALSDMPLMLNQAVSAADAGYYLRC